MREAIGKARIEDDGDPIGRIGDAVAQFVAGRRLHPAVGRQDPERRDGGADGDDQRRQHVEPRRHAVVAEQQHAEKRRLQEKRGEHFVADQRADHIADRQREAAPIGAELVGQHDARHHAHREGHREDAGPEPHQLLVAIVARAQPHGAERRNIGGGPDGEGREDNVKHDGEGELEAGQHDWIKIHCHLRASRPARTIVPHLNSWRAACVPRCLRQIEAGERAPCRHFMAGVPLGGPGSYRVGVLSFSPK